MNYNGMSVIGFEEFKKQFNEKRYPNGKIEKIEDDKVFFSGLKVSKLKNTKSRLGLLDVQVDTAWDDNEWHRSVEFAVSVNQKINAIKILRSYMMKFVSFYDEGKSSLDCVANIVTSNWEDWRAIMLDATVKEIGEFNNV